MLFAAFSTRQTTSVFCTLVLICFVCLHHSVHSSSTPAAVTSSDNIDNPLQQLPPTVLDAIRKGTIKESSALGLLKYVAALRESLSGGAAAERVLLSSGHGTPQHQQQQQQREPSRGILIVAGGSNQFRNAYIILKLLAHPDIRCTLPVRCYDGACLPPPDVENYYGIGSTCLYVCVQAKVVYYWPQGTHSSHHWFCELLCVCLYNKNVCKCV
jgi:hypothetical protein